MVQCYECGTVYPETMRCCPNCGSEAKIQLAPNSEFEEPKKPYVTVEVRDGKIAQIHGDHNSDPTEEVKKFVDLWSRKVLPMALRAV